MKASSQILSIAARGTVGAAVQATFTCETWPWH